MKRILAIPAAVAGRVRDAAAAVVGWVALMVVPESGEEAAVLVGMVLLAAGFLVANMPALALLVPGTLYVAIGLGFNLRRRS